MSEQTTINPGDTVEVVVQQWLANQERMQSRHVSGVVKEVRDRSILLDGVGIVREADACHRCHLPIDHAASRLIGYGPICCEKLGIDWVAKAESLTPEQIKEIRESVAKATRGQWWLPLKNLTVVSHERTGKAVPATKTANPRKCKIANGVATFTLPYGGEHFATIKDAIKAQGGRWNPDQKVWTLPAAKAATILKGWSFDVTGAAPSAQEVEAAPAPATSDEVREIDYTDGFLVKWGRGDSQFGEILQAVRALPGRTYRPDTYSWWIPTYAQAEVDAFARRFEFRYTERAAALLASTVAERERQQALVAASHQAESDYALGFDLPPGLAPRPYQLAYVEYAEACGGRLIDADEMGLGKGGTVDSLILTPTGWTRYGDIKVGDLVIGSNGQPTAVTGVYPRGELPVFRVTMSDGASVLVDDDHLWATRTSDQKWRGKPYTAKSTREIRSAPLTRPSGNALHYIPMVQPVEFEERVPLSIDPYVMGVLIGDGALSQDGVVFHKPDEELGERVAALLPAGVELRKYEPANRCTRWAITGLRHGAASNAVLNGLREMGLQGHTSPEKWVPERYKFASVASRIALLQGLLDTDGSCTGNTIEFSSSSRRLAEDVRFLVESLGGTTHFAERATSYTATSGDRVPGLPSYRVHLSLPASIQPFRLSRKLATYRVPTKYQPTRAIVSVVPEGTAQVVCIAVAAPDRLYVTERCIVTHNTIESILANHKLGGYPLLVVAPASVLLNWRREFNKWFPTLRVDVLKGRDLEVPQADVWITNYESLTYGFQANPMTGRKALALTPTAKNLIAAKPKAVIVDEAHYCKNVKAARTQAVAQVSEGTEIRQCLSGTPVPNHTEEIKAQLHIAGLLPKIGGEKGFDKLIGSGSDDRFEKLNEKLRATGYIRREKKQVMTELPEKSFVTEWLDEWEAGADYGAAYDDLVESYDRGSTINTLAALTKMRTITGRRKIAVAVEFVDNFLAETSDKLVITAYHREVQQEVWAQIKERHPEITVAHVFSSDSAEKRQEAIDTFQHDPKCRVIVISLKAGGIGITLTAAHDLIHLEQDWVPANMDQASDRIHRDGQKEACTIHELLAADSIDTILKGVQAKKLPEIVAATQGKGGAEAVKTGVMKAVIGELVRQYRRAKGVAA